MSADKKAFDESVLAELEELLHILSELDKEGVLQKMDVYMKKREMGYPVPDKEGMTDEEFQHVVKTLGKLCELMIQHDEIEQAIKGLPEEVSLDNAMDIISPAFLAEHYVPKETLTRG